MKDKLLIAGNEKEIDEVMNFIKKNNLLGKGKLFLFDTFPDLTDEYKEEQGLR